jgi:transposase
MRRKIPQLSLALEGNCTEHHRYLLGRLLSHIHYLENQIDGLIGRIALRTDELLPASDRERLDRIPGGNRLTIENVIAEIGADMQIFPDEHHLASWTGICPGNEESAGKRLCSRTRKGNRWLRRALTESTWATGIRRALLGLAVPAAQRVLQIRVRGRPRPPHPDPLPRKFAGKSASFSIRVADHVGGQI